MSSLQVGSLDVHADVEEDNVDRDSEPGSEDPDVNVDSISEIKFSLSMMSMEKAELTHSSVESDFKKAIAVTLKVVEGELE